MARLRIALLTGLVLATASLLVAQDKDPDKSPDQPAPAGTWKVYLPALAQAGGRPVLLIRLAKKDGTWTGQVLGEHLLSKCSLEKVSVKNKALTFTVKNPVVPLGCTVKLPADRKVAKLYGETTFRKSTMPIELERTGITSLDPFAQNREALNKEPLGVGAIDLALGLIRQAEAKKVKPAEVRSWAEKAVKSADLYGPGTQRDLLLRIAEALGEQKGFEAVALQYARRAERLLDEKEGPAAQKRVLSVLADVLEAAGKTEDAKMVRARALKLDFRIKTKTFSGRKDKNDRVVLAELFTGSQAATAVAPEVAMAGLLKTFKPSDLAVVEYHLHLAQPDPLACEEAELRYKFYGKALERLPAMILNGKLAVRSRGGAEDAQEAYDEYVEQIQPLLEEKAEAQLKLTATRKGDKVSIGAEVARLDGKADYRLRLVLVEPTVNYKGANGQTIHHNVARSMPGGADGTAIKGKMLKKTFTVDLAALRKTLNAYLDKVKENREFPDKMRPLALKKLRVIGFVQNEDKGEVLQTAQIDVTSD